MTANQIAYAKHLEDQRHNLVQEKHEHYSTRTARMAARAQRSQAGTAAARQREEARHNIEGERVNWWNAQEANRHNLASERLTQQQNVWEHAFKESQAEASLRQAAVSERQAAVSESNAETQRQLAATESSRVQLQHAYNMGQLSARSAELGFSYANLSELTRHNVEQESVGRTNATSQRISANASQTTAQAATRHAKVAERNASVNEQNAATNRKNATSSRIQAVASVGGAIAQMGRTLVPLINGGLS